MDSREIEGWTVPTLQSVVLFTVRLVVSHYQSVGPSTEIKTESVTDLLELVHCRRICESYPLW